MRSTSRVLAASALASMVVLVTSPGAFAATIVKVDIGEIPGSPDATGAWYPKANRLCAEDLHAGSEAVAYLQRPNGKFAHAYDLRFHDPGSTCHKVRIGHEHSTARLHVCVIKDDLPHCSPWRIVYT